MDKRKRNFIAAVLWFLLILILLTLPGYVLPKENWLDRIWADKWIHIFLFGVFVFLWSAAFASITPEKKDLRKILLWLLVFGIIYGIGMEFIQKYFISNRSFDILDIIADTIGCLAGFVFSLGRYIKK